MSEHTIINTDQLKINKKLKIKGLTPFQKKLFLGTGGVAALLASGVIYNLLNSKESNFVQEVSMDPSSPFETNSASINEESIEEDYASNDVIENVVEVDISKENIENIKEEDTVEEATFTFTADTNIQFSNLTNDNMSFSEAFSIARADAGSDGFFNWNGESYSTYTKEEWNSMSEEEQIEFFEKVADEIDTESVEWEEDSVEVNATNSSKISEDIDEIITENPESLQAAEDSVNIESSVDDIIIVRPQYGVADMNDDGSYDAIVMDSDGDGYADVLVLDENYDGVYEGFMIDEDGDQDLDIFIIDEGGDGIDSNDLNEEISNVVNMEDFIILEDDDPQIEEFDFIDELFNRESTNIDDELNIDDHDELSIDDENFEEPGL